MAQDRVNGASGTRRPPPRATEKAAAKGSAHAMDQLGAFYLLGLSVAEDDDKANEWFEKGTGLSGQRMT